jgi:hypothetical protein
MAALTWYFKDAVPSGATLHRSLSESASGISAAITGTGWTVGTTVAIRYCLQNGGSKQAAANFSSTAMPSVAPSQSVGDCWRTENTYTGGFDDSSWVFTLGLESVSAAASGTVLIRIRLWHSTDANGVGATEWTGSTQATTTVGPLSTSSPTTLSVTWSPTLPMSTKAVGEYIFVQIALEVITASGSSSADALLCTDTTKFTVVTSLFTAYTGTQSVPKKSKASSVSTFMSGSAQTPVNGVSTHSKSTYVAPYIAAPPTWPSYATAGLGLGRSPLPAMATPPVDVGGSASGYVKINGTPVPYARVACYYRPTAGLVNVTFCDINGNFTFTGLDRTALSDNSYFFVAIDPNGLATQYNSGLYDRVIPG